MASRDFRAPGVYYERRARIGEPVSLDRTGIPAFLGLTSRGPLETPQKVHSFDEFQTVFGPPIPGAYLADAVYGFFANGGDQCYLVRIAHTRGDDDKRARRADHVFNDKEGRESLLIEAANEGAWGDEIEVELRVPEAGVQTYLTFDMQKGETRATVKSARGFERGTLVRIYDGKREHYATLNDVESKVLRWRKREACPFDFKSSDLTYIEPVEFEIHVREGSKREVFRGLSLAAGSERHPERLVNASSELIRVHLLNAFGSVAERMPQPMDPLRLSGGQDGLEFVVPADFIGYNRGPGDRVGLGALEANEEIDLLVCPDVMYCLEHGTGFKGPRDVEAVQEAVLTQCELLKDRFAILDVPKGYEPEKALSWRLQFDSDFGAFYYPWIAILKRGQQRLVPPSGHIAGMYNRCDRENGPHRAAANEVLQGAVFLEYPLDEEMLGYLNAHQLNPIRLTPSRGIRVWGARTISSRGEWRYVTVRRVMNAVRRSVYHGTQWVVFEPNEPALWQRIERQLKTFFAGLFERGFFAGETVDSAFFVKCDAETNPPARRDAGELVAQIGIAPVRPAEFITFVLEQQLPETG